MDSLVAVLLGASRGVSSRAMLALRTTYTYTTRLIPRHTRHFSVSPAHHLSPNHNIYVSESTNPYFNLTFEDWLFRHKPVKEPLLLLYRDTPCVVIGRNQNPWKEVNFPALRHAGIPFIRRRSGGGTVYHDLGNTNFSLHLPRAEFDRHATAQVVLRAVRALGLDGAHVNDRNDVCVDAFKVSGSAYKIVRERAYHHGTMLISSRLHVLGAALRVAKDTMVTRGVASVRSPVRNLRDFRADVTHEAFVDAVVRAFREEYHIDEPVQFIKEEQAAGIDYIRNGMAELPSWDWAFGQTPEFTYKLHQSFSWGDVTANLHSRHGIILSCDIVAADETVQRDLEAVGTALRGQKYGFVDDTATAVGGVPTTGPARQVWDWLKQEMSS